MPVTNFNDPIDLMPDGSLEVSGPFKVEGKNILGDVMIRFVLIQQLGAGAPKVLMNPAVLQSGESDWKHTVPKNVVDEQQFQIGKARAIGLAVAVTRSAETEIPAFETVTWCQDVEIRLKLPI